MKNRLEIEMLENQRQSSTRQKRLIFLCWLVYMIAYLGRYSYNANIKIIGDYFAQGKDNTGLVTTTFFFAYGAGQIINGLLCKRYNKKYVLSGALILSSIINVVIGLGIDFTYYKYLWLVNGATQSVLWSSLILTLGENLDEEHLKKGILAMATTVPVGTFIAYGSSALFSVFTKFNASFIMAAICMTIVAIIWFLEYSKNTTTIQNEHTEVRARREQTNQKLSSSLILTIIIICIFAVICNLVKDGLQTWTPDVLAKNHNLPNGLSIILTLSLPVVGVFGATLAVFLQSKINNYVLVLGIFFFLASILLIGVVLLMQVSWVPVIMLMALAFCMSQGMNNVITSIAPLQLRNKINSGMITGVFNGCCYVGSTISGYGLGALVESRNGDWNAVFVLLIALCVVAVLISSVVCVITRLKKKQV